MQKDGKPLLTVLFFYVSQRQRTNLRSQFLSDYNDFHVAVIEFVQMQCHGVADTVKGVAAIAAVALDSIRYFVAIALLSGFIPILGKLPLTPLLIIYIIYRYRKGKELKKKNHEELMEFQEQLRAKKAKTESNSFAGSYVTEESYDEYQARKQAEEEEMILMQEAYDQEEERLQRLEEEWQAHQALFQEIHGDHYDN